MKKIILIIAMMFATLNLHAAKMSGPDENGRIYNTAYFDVISGDQPPVMDVITYSKRMGTFDWSKLIAQMETSTASKVKIKIITRVEIPDAIKTAKVYVTEGEFYNAFATLNTYSKSSTSWRNTPDFDADSFGAMSIRVKTYWNDKVQGGQDVLLVQPKKDTFGNRYVEYKLVIEFNEHSKYYDNDYIARSYKEEFEKIKFKIAPKSRTFQSKWIEPKIYVLDE